MPHKTPSLYEMLTGHFTGGLELHQVSEQNQIILSVLDNMQRILNCRAGTLSHLPDYGLPDMSNILQGLPGTAHQLMSTLSDVLLKYEPRLKSIEVVMREQAIPGELRYVSDPLMQLLDEQPEATEGDLQELLRPILREHFQPALLARFQTVIYRPLSEPAMRTIVEMKLGQVSQRLHRHYGLTTHIDENLSDALTAACLLPDTGARNIDSLLNQQILPVLSQQLLTHMAAKQKPASLTLGWSEDEGIVLEFAHD